MENKDTKEAVGPARVGIGGPVGSGKTALIEQLLPRLEKRGISTAVIRRRGFRRTGTTSI